MEIIAMILMDPIGQLVLVGTILKLWLDVAKSVADLAKTLADD